MPATKQEARLLFTAHHYGTEAGLPHRTVFSITQDHRGFLWVGTARGLARFDGYGFQVYSMANGLSGSEVSLVECDSEGMLWVLCSNGSITIMDPRTGAMKSIQEHFAGRLPAEAEGPFTSFVASPEGDIIFAQKGYLFRFKGAAEPFDIMKVDCQYLLRVVQVTGRKEAWCHCQTDGGLWTKRDLMRIPFPGVGEGGGEHRNLRSESLGMSPRPMDLSDWRPSQDVGLYFWAPEGVAWVPTGQSPFQVDRRAIHPEQSISGVFFIMPLTDDVWLVNNTVRRMQAGEGPFTAPVLFDLASTFPDAAYFMHAVLRDRAGNVWVGGEFGLYKITMQPAYFQHLLQDTAGGNKNGYKVRGMVVNGGRLHVNTEVQGYWVLDAATGAVLSTDPKAELRQMMVEDGMGGLWRVAGVDLLHENASGQVDRTILAPQGVYPPWSARVLKNGTLLAGTAKGLRIAAAHADSSRACPSGQASLDHAWVWQLMYDRNDNLFACTTAGLFRLDEQGQALERWWSGAKEVKDTAHYLPTDDIRNYHVDPEGIFWLATATQGLLRWDRSKGEVRSLSTRDGFPDASIHAVLPDAGGALWMPTDNGLVRYDPATGTAKTYTTNDGLPSNEFNRLAFAQGQDGRLYLGGLNGIAAFNPADLRDPAERPMAPLVISGVYKQLEENQGQEDLTTQVLDGAPIIMQPSDRFFTVDMVLLSYEDPSQIRYAWRLQGVDAVWNEQQEPRLRINTLPYGDHVLQIKAMDAKGHWTEAGLSIPITMIRPIHLRWWFILAAILVAVLIIFAMVRYRERQLLHVIRMRDHIASDLHDEVGSTLSSIVLFSSAVGRQTGTLSQEARNMLNRIKDNSTRAMESMNDIVWSVNTDHDTLEDLVDRMRAYAQPLCESLDVDLKFVLDSGMVARKLGMEARKNIYLIFKEAVNNAAKHSRCTEIMVRFGQVGGKLELVVLDDGIGITTPRPEGRLRLGEMELGI